MRKNSSCFCPAKRVPHFSPSMILWMLWKSPPLAITMSAPAAIAIRAAVSLVAIPPVPTFTACGTFSHVQKLLIQMLYGINKLRIWVGVGVIREKTTMSDIRIRRSAPIRAATTAGKGILISKFLQRLQFVGRNGVIFIYNGDHTH